MSHDDKDSQRKQLHHQITELQNQLQQVLAINQFQRQAWQALAHAHWEEDNDTLLLGISLTDQWQTQQEQRIKQALQQIQLSA